MVKATHGEAQARKNERSYSFFLEFFFGSFFCFKTKEKNNQPFIQLEQNKYSDRNNKPVD